MLSFDNVYQRYIVDKVHDVDIRIKNDLLLSIQNHDKERYHRTIDCIPYDISNVFKLAYMIHLLDDLVFNFLKACKDEDWSILKDHPIANILKEKIKEYEKKLASLDEDSEERFIMLEGVMQLSKGLKKKNPFSKSANF